ncbi:OLC1v1013733C3 [Oldenlandia corymbosa var. corymbosa]|uniref:OLC1v1013733C3 n=2 Tax=Oldenlandia corymbosa var. corymbosa TaxID=529605 RepID=A0AAV1E2L2_OLDCO|nr:OLC1v1013733C3 [Oldenlandia corymbosa var. corymbosa]
MISQPVSGEVKPRFPAASLPLPSPRDYHRAGSYRVPAIDSTEKMQCISKRLSLSHSSISRFNRAFAETSNPVRGSNLWIRKNLSASSAVADPDPDPGDVSPKLPKEGRKRISKAERKMLLESFVNSYRAMNSGKFPTPSEAKREVGGGYYAVKKIIQEMEYGSHISSASLSGQFQKGGEDEKREQLIEEVERQEIKLSRQETMVTEVKEEKEVSEIPSSCEKDPLSDPLVTNGEIVKSAQPAHKSMFIEEKEEKEVPGIINLSPEKDPIPDAPITSEEIMKSGQPEHETMVTEEKQVSEIINLSCEKDPLSDPLVTNREIVKSAQPERETMFVEEKEEKGVPEIINLSREKDPISDAPIMKSAQPEHETMVTEEKQVSEIINLSCEKDPLSDAQITNEEIGKSAQPEHGTVVIEEKEVSEIINLSCEKDHVSDAQITNEDIVKSAQPKTEEPLRDLTEEQRKDVESPKKSFGWNLKSIADGIVSFWRKL